MTDPSVSDSTRSRHLDTTADAYDAVADLYADMARNSLDALPLDRAMLAAFADLVRGATSPDRPVAELGCGPGYLTEHLRSLGLTDIFGVDISPGLLDLAREAYPHLRFEQGSMDALDLPDGSLAGVVSWYSVIHTPPTDLPSHPPSSPG